MNFLKTTLDCVFDRVLPKRCSFCDVAVTDISLCDSCRSELPWLQHSCKQCALELDPLVQVRYCGGCISKPPYFDATFAVFKYESPILEVIKSLKFAKNLYYSRLLADLLTEKLMDLVVLKQYKLPEAIIPVPLHIDKLYMRSFNQTLEIAKCLSENLNIKIVDDICWRVVDKIAQTKLSKKMRYNNLHGVFEAKATKLKHVAILDDVMTTGATANELARVLKQIAKISVVDVWCLCRTHLL